MIQNDILHLEKKNIRNGVYMNLNINIFLIKFKFIKSLNLKEIFGPVNEQMYRVYYL